VYVCLCVSLCVFAVCSGVQHFFIYCTLRSQAGQLRFRSLLQDYILNGTVTLVPWPFANCVKGGGSSGRWTSFYDPDRINPNPAPGTSSHLFHLHPPNRITQSAAVASCYLRFRHLTKYMAHIDDDEFLAIHPDAVANVKIPQLAKKRVPKSVTSNLVDFSNWYFKAFPNAPALKLMPVMFRSGCSIPSHFRMPSTSTSASTSPSSSSSSPPPNSLPVFPRLGRAPFARPGMVGEGKMIFRTDKVDMFYMHFLISVRDSDSPRKAANLLVPLSVAALLHFKAAPRSQSSFTGRMFPLNEAEEAMESCNGTHYWPLYQPPAADSVGTSALRRMQREYEEFQIRHQARFQWDKHNCTDLWKSHFLTEGGTVQGTADSLKGQYSIIELCSSYAAPLSNAWRASTSTEPDYNPYYFTDSFIKELSAKFKIVVEKILG
jgi:hypothetical protein